MKRGVPLPGLPRDKIRPPGYRVFVLLGRQEVIDSRFSTVICAPVYSKYDGNITHVEVGIDEGLKCDSAVYCDELVSVIKSSFINYIGFLSPAKMEAVNSALRVALALE
ncbi:MAG: type II toxin-antitoxin system PemK/MazF family toxin [Treponematales bacterium]